jgi:hypothetical protein
MAAAERLQLHGDRPRLRVSTAEVWRQARALHPAGTRLVRIIDLASGLQSFKPIAETELNFMDEATYVMPSGPHSQSNKLWDDVIADYNARYLEVTA